MASWKDGAAYAPIERPHGFAMPNAEPLDVAPTPEQVTPGAVPPPKRLDTVEAPPLAQLGTHTRQQRDPSSPFDVTQATLTAAATMPDGTRDPRAPFDVARSSPLAPTMPPPPSDAIPLSFDAPPAQGLPRRVMAGGATSEFVDDEDRIRSQRTLLKLCLAMMVFASVFHVAAPLLIVLAGLLAVLRIPWANRAGATALGVGGFLLLVQLLVPEAREGIGGFAAIIIGIWFTALLLSGPNDQGGPPDAGGPPPRDAWYPQQGTGPLWAPPLSLAPPPQSPPSPPEQH